MIGPASNVSILVPTLDRPAFVVRMLRYYAAVEFAGAICVVDASRAEQVAEVTPVVQELQSRLRIVYVSLPGASDSAAVKHAIDVSPTPYAVFTGDDDFLIPTTLDECVAALESDPGLSAVHGRGVVAITDGDGPRRPIVSVLPYRQPSLRGQTAAARVLEHLTDYTVSLFSVQRVEVWRAMYRDVLLISDRALEEIHLSCFSAVHGRILGLPPLGLVRQDHVGRFQLPAGLDWVTKPRWADSYATFSRLLAEEIAGKDRIPTSQARAVVRQAFWAYLAKLLNSQWHGAFEQPLTSVPGVTRVWRGIGSRGTSLMRRLGGSPPMLDRLRHRSSPDHGAFEPVFRAMTGMQ